MIFHMNRQWDQVRLLNLDFSLLPVPVVLTSVAFGLLGVGWCLIVRMVNLSLPFMQALSIWLVPNAGKYVPGKVLMFGGRLELLHLRGQRRASGTMALTFEHIAMILAAAPFTSVAVFNGLQFSSTATLIIMAFVCGSCLTFVFAPKLLVQLFNRVLVRFNREILVCTIQRKHMIAAFSTYAAAWLVYGLAGYWGMKALGIHDVPVFHAVVISVAAWMIGFLSFITPGGMGVREAVYTGFLSAYISPAQAMACALLLRLIWTAVEWGGVALGAVVLSKSERVVS